jgi:hypothetical protein
MQSRPLASSAVVEPALDTQQKPSVSPEVHVVQHVLSSPVLLKDR